MGGLGIGEDADADNLRHGAFVEAIPIGLDVTALGEPLACFGVAGFDGDEFGARGPRMLKHGIGGHFVRPHVIDGAGRADEGVEGDEDARGVVEGADDVVAGAFGALADLPAPGAREVGGGRDFGLGDEGGTGAEGEGAQATEIGIGLVADDAVIGLVVELELLPVVTDGFIEFFAEEDLVIGPHAEDAERHRIEEDCGRKRRKFTHGGSVA